MANFLRVDSSALKGSWGQEGTVGRTLHVGRLISVFAFPLVFAACGGAQNIDLNAVKQYATTTEQARSSFDALAADYDQSCDRSRELVLAERSATEFPLSTRSISVQSIARKPVFFVSAALNERCIVATHPSQYPLGIVSRDWQRANDTVLDFVKGIGAIAGVDSNPKNLKPLTGAAVDAKLISQSQAEAADRVLTGITNFFYHNTERKDIASFLDIVSPDFPKAIDTLATAAESYKVVVSAECINTDNFYLRTLKATQQSSSRLRINSLPSKPRTILITQLPLTKGADPAAWSRHAEQFRIRQLWASDRTACARRLDGADAYEKTLSVIGDTEEKLAESSHRRATLRSTIDLLSQDSGDLSDAVSTLYDLVLGPASGKGKGK